MKIQQKRHIDCAAPLDFIAYVFDRKAFLIRTQDDEASASEVDPLYSFHWVSSDMTPEPQGDPKAFQAVPREVLVGYVSDLVQICFEAFFSTGKSCVGLGKFREKYKQHMEALLGVPMEDWPIGCAISRTSYGMHELEAEAQRHRLHTQFMDELQRGFIPGLWVADFDETGQNMMRPGLLRALGAAFEGQIQGLFLHTLERYSRSELDGVSILHLAHYLTGNVFYNSLKFDHLVRFDTTDRRSVLLAAEEILEGAKEGEVIWSRMQRGLRGAVQRTQAFSGRFGSRIFFRAKEVINNRVVPEMDPWQAAKFQAMASILRTYKSATARKSFAWWHRLSEQEYERQMTSDWILGYLVLPMDDWRPGKNKQQQDTRGDAPFLPEMCFEEAADMDTLRESFQWMRDHKEDESWFEVHQSRELEAFRTVFNKLTRHKATGFEVPVLGPAIDSGRTVFEGGRDPIYCAVRGCGAIADIVSERHGTDDGIETAVCRKNPNHRHPPLLKRALRQACQIQGPSCSYCGDDTQPLQHGQYTVRAYFYKCKQCPEPTIMPFQYNPALRMEWLSQGVLASKTGDAATRNGWPPFPAYVQSKKQERLEMTERDAVLLDIDAGLRQCDPAELHGRTGTKPSIDNLRLRYYIWHNFSSGVKLEYSYYVDWAVKILGYSRKEAQAAMRSLSTFFHRKHGKVIYASYRQFRDKPRAILAAAMDAHEAEGGLRENKEYIDLLRSKCPEYTGHGIPLLVSREKKRRRGKKAQPNN